MRLSVLQAQQDYSQPAIAFQLSRGSSGLSGGPRPTQVLQGED